MSRHSRRQPGFPPAFSEHYNVSRGQSFRPNVVVLLIRRRILVRSMLKKKVILRNYLAKFACTNINTLNISIIVFSLASCVFNRFSKRQFPCYKTPYSKCFYKLRETITRSRGQKKTIYLLLSWEKLFALIWMRDYSPQSLYCDFILNEYVTPQWKVNNYTLMVVLVGRSVVRISHYTFVGQAPSTSLRPLFNVSVSGSGCVSGRFQCGRPIPRFSIRQTYLPVFTLL